RRIHAPSTPRAAHASQRPALAGSRWPRLSRRPARRWLAGERSLHARKRSPERGRVRLRQLAEEQAELAAEKVFGGAERVRAVGRQRKVLAAAIGRRLPLEEPCRREASDQLRNRGS